MMFRKCLLGRKLGMTQIFEKDGRCIPVTALHLGPNTVVQVKASATGKGTSSDGYSAIQLGFGDKPFRKLTKAMAGHFTAADKRAQGGGNTVAPKWFLRELRVADEKVAEYQVGQVIKADLFEVGQLVDVTGTSKGKGTAGVMKRHHMKGSKNATHGTHEYFRHGGSIGMRTTPGRVNRGKRMGGHMGAERVTVQNLKIVKIDLETNTVLVEGAIPGPVNGYVMVRESIKVLGQARRKRKTAA
jgi:large subunit ribosomal protein L3